MMDAKHLERAKQIVDGIAYCQRALSFEQPEFQVSNKIYVERKHSGLSPETAQYPMSRAMRDVAFRAWRREIELKLAAYRREAAQIGLRLED